MSLLNLRMSLLGYSKVGLIKGYSFKLLNVY